MPLFSARHEQLACVDRVLPRGKEKVAVSCARDRRRDRLWYRNCRQALLLSPSLMCVWMFPCALILLEELEYVCCLRSGGAGALDQEWCTAVQSRIDPPVRKTARVAGKRLWLSSYSMDIILAPNNARFDVTIVSFSDVSYQVLGAFSVPSVTCS